MNIKNEKMTVAFDPALPLVSAYHLAGGVMLTVCHDQPALVVNGTAYLLETVRSTSWFAADRASFTLFLDPLDCQVQLDYALTGHSLSISIGLEDPLDIVKTMDFQGISLISLDKPDWRVWRNSCVQRNWGIENDARGGGAGLYGTDMTDVRLSNAVPDPYQRETMHACFYNGQICCFAVSNYPVKPYTTRFIEHRDWPGRSGRFDIGLNRYQYRSGAVCLPPLHVDIIISGDLNGDGQADYVDYQLYLNRTFPAPDPLYRQSIWYKIKLADHTGRILTTLDQVRDIVRTIWHFTAGRRQLVYLVGWEQGVGPSTGNPDPALGSSEDYARLSDELEHHYNTLLSFHINLDDIGADHPDFGMDIVCRDVDGTPVKWIDVPEIGIPVAYHISHTKDVETGKVFRRIDRLLSVLPIRRTVHIDAYRICNESWEADGRHIGVIEELYNGLMPINAYFKQLGIDISTEGINGMPINGPELFSGFWHNSFGVLYHGRLIGGGYCLGNNWNWGSGAGIDADFYFSDKAEENIPDGFQEYSLQRNTAGILDLVAMGTLLYQYFLEREMVDVREWTVYATNGSRHYRRIRYDDGTLAEMEKQSDSLLVVQGDRVIATSNERFVPLGNQLLCYSRAGFCGAIRLPEFLRNQTLSVSICNAHGQTDAFTRHVTDNIELEMNPRHLYHVSKAG